MVGRHSTHIVALADGSTVTSHNAPCICRISHAARIIAVADGATIVISHYAACIGIGIGRRHAARIIAVADGATVTSSNAACTGRGRHAARIVAVADGSTVISRNAPCIGRGHRYSPFQYSEIFDNPGIIPKKSCISIRRIDIQTRYRMAGSVKHTVKS